MHATLATHRTSGTLVGAVAVILWGQLPLLRLLAEDVPPLQMLAFALATTFAIGAVRWMARHENPITRLRHPIGLWLAGVSGLAGSHLAYFLALGTADPVGVALLAYTWPFLTVLASAVFLGERLRANHGLGVVLGFAGAAVLVVGEGTTASPERSVPGYLLAFLSALLWTVYSVRSRQSPDVGVDALAGFAGAGALCAFVLHLLLEQTHWPQDYVGMLAMLAIGLGPMGASFFFWDYGVKHGDVRVLGPLAYGAPVLSAAMLVLAGEAELSTPMVIAASMILTGALAAFGGFRKRSELA